MESEVRKLTTLSLNVESDHLFLNSIVFSLEDCKVVYENPELIIWGYIFEHWKIM